MLEAARSQAQRLFDIDPQLSDPDLRLLVGQVEQFWSQVS